MDSWHPAPPDQPATPALLPRRVHLPVQPADLSSPRAAVLPAAPAGRWHRPAPSQRAHRRHRQRLGRTPRRLSVNCTQADMQVVNSISISHTPMPSPIRLRGSGRQSTHTLSRVDDDAHPGAAEAPAWKCVQEDTTNDRPWDTPGLVKVVEAKEHTVCYPAPPAKYALHLGQ